jgi:hypothetical protein
LSASLESEHSSLAAHATAAAASRSGTPSHAAAAAEERGQMVPLLQFQSNLGLRFNKTGQQRCVEFQPNP